MSLKLDNEHATKEINQVANSITLMLRFCFVKLNP